MEHEVFVPVPVASLRRALGDPACVARCVPGIQQDADGSAGPLSGRLKVRIDGHTITYRGTLILAEKGEDAFSVTGEGVEARGTGSVKLALTIGLTRTDGGTTIGFTGTASGDGRLVELDAQAASAAARRLLDRFTQQLVTESLASPGPDPDEAPSDGPTADRGSVFDAPVPPPALDPAANRDVDRDIDPDPDPDTASGMDADVEFTVPDGPPAEAAHARRTMIGRSTEEVDHAPPRGRYAPVPSQEALTAGTALRWVAPAAALAIASAVVVSRVLRRRR